MKPTTDPENPWKYALKVLALLLRCLLLVVD